MLDPLAIGIMDNTAMKISEKKMNTTYQSGFPKLKYTLKNMNTYHSHRRENLSEGIPLMK